MIWFFLAFFNTLVHDVFEVLQPELSASEEIYKRVLL